LVVPLLRWADATAPLWRTQLRSTEHGDACAVLVFHPAAFDPALLFEAMKQRIEGGHVKAQGAARPDLD
jgi:hypothetical protein